MLHVLVKRSKQPVDYTAGEASNTEVGNLFRLFLYESRRIAWNLDVSFGKTRLAFVDSGLYRLVLQGISKFS